MLECFLIIDTWRLFLCASVYWQAEMSILDEIDSGLDIDALRDVAAAVNGLKKPGNSVLMVTHYKVRVLEALKA
jgi:Fe-S cluster assembly ATPase SufC